MKRSLETDPLEPNKKFNRKPPAAAKGYYKGKFQKHSRLITHTAVRGILVSCTQNREGLALNQLLRLLGQAKDLLRSEFVEFETPMVYQVPLDLDQDAHQQEYYEKSRTEIAKSEEDSEADAGGDADAEKESQVKPRTPSSFQVYDASCQGLIFIGIRHDLDPAPFLRRFMELTIPSEDGSPAKLKWPKETFIERLLPVQKTCAATLATIAETIKPMIAQHLGDDVEPTSWGIVAHHRNNPDVARKSLIDTVAALVPSKHPVELSKPTVTIIIEVIKSACCISFSRDFNTLAKYNPSNYILQKSKSGLSSASEQASSSNAQS